MSNFQPNAVTLALDRLQRGDHAAADEVLGLVYEELRLIARSYMARQGPGQTIQPTMVVHDAFLRLLGQDVEWNNRAHFLGYAALAMRQVISNHRRDKRAKKRGGDRQKLTLNDQLDGKSSTDIDLIAIHDVLEQLEALDPRQAKVVHCRFFSGMTSEEISEFLGVSVATVEREWRAARAWLNLALQS